MGRLTGTIPKSDWESASLRSSLGEVINKLSAKELQDEGVLANCHVNIVQTQETAVYANYQNEMTFLLEDKKRLDYISSMIKDISKTGNTLVLTNRIKNGEALQELIPDAEFVQGSMAVTDRKDAYNDINEGTNTITIATYGGSGSWY